MSKDKRIFINYNFNRNAIKDVIIENNLQENFVDVWIPNTLYNTATTVFSVVNGKYYTCVNTHTSSSDINTDIANWVDIGNNNQFRQTATQDDKGLLFFDIYLNRLKIWDGNRFRIIKYLDDIENSFNDNIQLDDIWVDSELIPTTEINANNTNILYKHNNISTSHVTQSYSFKITAETGGTNSWATFPNGEKRLAIDNIVPSHYGATAFYKPVLRTYNNTIIPEGFNGWQLVGDTIYFNNFSNSGSIIVNENYPPNISFYEYVGRRLNYATLGGNNTNTTIQIAAINGTTSGNNFILPIVGSVNNINQIMEVSINGILIYNSYIVSAFNEITIDTDIIGYKIESDDYIYVTTK